MESGFLQATGPYTLKSKLSGNIIYFCLLSYFLSKIIIHMPFTEDLASYICKRWREKGIMTKGQGCGPIRFNPLLLNLIQLSEIIAINFAFGHYILVGHIGLL